MYNKIILFLALISPFTIFAQMDFSYPTADGEVEINQRMQELGIPGVSIAVIKDGQIHTVMQWGQANPNTGATVQATTLFQAGSMTAGLTGIAVLKAVEEGKIDLQTDINQYLTSWKLPENKYTKNDPVTVLDLLLKRRGFTQNQKPKGYAQGTALPSLLEVLNGLGNTKAVKLRSGTHQQENYSFETEVILQQLLEDVYNQKFQEIIQTQVMIPAGMKNSSIQVLLDEEAKSRAAIGFDEANKMIPGGWNIYPESASAGLWTTAEDYAKMIQQLLLAYQGKEGQLLSPAMAKQALTKAHNSKAMLYNNWGPEANFGYGGAPMGYYATFEANPEQDWAVVILCNKFLQWRFVNELRAGLKTKFELGK